MHLSIAFPKIVFGLLACLYYLSIQVSSLTIPSGGNLDMCDAVGGPGFIDGDGDLDPNPVLDGPTSDKSAGIGFEFESGQIQFRSKKTCTAEQTVASKGKPVRGHTGTNWELTGDVVGPGSLVAEYILDGTKIKIGGAMSYPAASGAAQDLSNWNPYENMAKNEYQIEGSPCNPWVISEPKDKDQYTTFSWQPQITAPMPLEAIDELISWLLIKYDDQHSNIITRKRRPIGVLHVTKDFFQSSPNEMGPDGIRADVYGYLSLLVNYATGSKRIGADQSPKWIIDIMPRTDWTTMYSAIKSQIKGDLYELLKVLACYQNGQVLNPLFCTGTPGKPVPTNYMDTLSFLYSKNPDSGHVDDKLLVKDWIKSITDNELPDKLTIFDTNFNGQVGGLGSATENLFQTTDRAVPLFEFRRLYRVKSPQWEGFVEDAEQEVIDFHRKYKTAPQLRKRRIVTNVDPCAGIEDFQYGNSQPSPNKLA